MIASRILLVVIPLAASSSACFDPTLRPTGDADEPFAESSGVDASSAGSSTAMAHDEADSTGDATSEDESSDDSTNSDSTTGASIDALCGDGRIGTDENCDDANDRDGDGCSGCTTDPGWECHDEPSVCLETCGPLPQDCLHP